MRKIWLDFETYSEADLRKVGAWQYARHPSTEVICMAYAIDDGAPALWLPGDATPDFVHDTQNCEFHAWNSFFECVIWTHVQGWAPIEFSQWHDTAAAAAAMALPRALGACGVVLGLPEDQQKDKRGRYLIQRLCKPSRGKRVRDPDLLRELYDYCVQDVVAERHIAKFLRPLNPTEREVWLLDQRVNWRGVHIDTDSVDAARRVATLTADELNAEVEQVSGGVLPDVGSRANVLAFAESDGYPMAGYDKQAVSDALADDKLPSRTRRLLEIRQSLGKTSVRKYDTLTAVTDSQDNRARGLLMYHGASTGRWSGQKFQPQNLPRGSFNDIDACLDTLRDADLEWIRCLYGDPMEALSTCVRGMITAPKGKRLYVADYSAIEARVLPWLSGQSDVLDVFRGHGKIYEHTASKIYRIPIELVNKDQRFVGKCATLALGYQGGKTAFANMAANYNVVIDEDQAEQIKVDWRESNQRTVQFWYDVEKAAISAVDNPGRVVAIRSLQFRVAKRYLWMKLPSGRLIAWCRPRIEEGKFGSPQITYEGTNSYTRKWERQSTYGGDLVQSATQATARDLMAAAMLRIDNAKFDIVLSVHDELVAEGDPERHTIDQFVSLMTELPVWATGLPVAAEGFDTHRYRKG